MKARKYILALSAFFVAAIGIAACGSGVPGNSVAVVAGNPITTQAFNHWMYVAAKGQAAQSPGAPVIVPNDPPSFKNCIAQVRAQIPSLAKSPNATIKGDCGQLFTSLSSQVMDFLIKAYWYQADAAQQHITVSSSQIQKAFQSAKSQQFPNDAAYRSFLNQTGQTQEDILFRVRVNQIYQKLIAKYTPTVSNAQIQNYYNAHQSQFGTPEQRDIRIVLAKTQAQANAAKAALSHGQSWNAVAKKYSTDASSKNNGGLLTNISKGQEDTALDSAAFSAPINKLLGPIHGQFGYYVFEVTKITPQKLQSFAQASPGIRSTLLGNAQNSARTAVDNRAKKNWFSKTQCRSTYAMADCHGYKPPKASTSNSVTPTPSTTTTR